MSSKEELDVVLERIRYHDEYRTKVFGFYVTLNGALMLFIETFNTSTMNIAFLCLYAFIVSMFGLLNSLRSTRITDKYREAAVNIEQEIGFNHLLAVHKDINDEIKGKKFVLRYAYTFFYTAMLVMWLAFSIQQLR